MLAVSEAEAVVEEDDEDAALFKEEEDEDEDEGEAARVRRRFASSRLARGSAHVDGRGSKLHTSKNGKAD